LSAASENSVKSVRQRRDLLDVKNQLDGTQRKLARTERALESLSRILSLIPDPIEVVSSDYTVMFANRASRLLHENEQLEGTFYFESVMGLDKPSEPCPIRRAIEDDREAAYTAACDNGDVFEVAVTPIVLADGRRAAMCYSKLAVLAGGGTNTSDELADPPPIVIEKNVDIPDIDEMDLALGESVTPTIDDKPPPAWDDEEKKVLEQIAQMSSRTLDAVLDQVTDGVLMIDSVGTPILFNRAFAELSGLAAESNPEHGAADALGRILFPDRAPGTSPVTALNDLSRGGEIRRFETAILGTDGHPVPVEMAVSRLPDESGLAGAAGSERVLLVTVRDLRETREIKDQLITALNRSLAGDRIANLAHQVNNYLTPAGYHADQLAQSDHLDARTHRLVTTIQNYLNMSHESILMVLSLIRPSSPTAIDTNHMISELFSRHDLAEELRLDNIEVVQRYDPGMVETTGYRVLLQQALLNIIKNAREAMVRNSDGGRLMVLTEASPSTITIRITDNGPGIPKDIQEEIFDLLFTTKPAGKGRGVGLHFSKEVIARHDGAITVKSRPGEGATFEVRLPVRRAERPGAIETSDYPVGAPVRDNPRNAS